MSNIDYQALREKAEKATSGVWSLEYGEERFDAGDALIHREVVGYLPICRIEGAHPESGFDEDFQMEQQANAEFIAAANPATVLALLDELETAKKRIAEQEAEPVSQTYKLNELSGNSPVTPDGWISCSERMPDDGQHVIILCDGAFVLYAQYRDGEFFDIVRNGDEFFETQSRNVTDWMRLPEPPQEVNRG
ncbi:ead/Ea22-like family protein [Escherichia coli]|uniref:ead/Ea22-like family protein n=1 Tax=Escherichia coli TaxID=562 RepID=UPI001594B980|nr:ead/Ea22-like family protein [Escherichia coli]NVF78920.1 ead/Ea22-like family protein [Escherichia coli]NVG26813.1 ead/Ea22-like family protein [Escherichia coli]NVG32644.1 ead/Ea22-like family protein [Escherichia coli]NVG51458.1 ead/Ea22-like family protein [Escherichia coli]HEA3576804.1 ead/Ea22-like family protein [Escherichia coli]